jgi:hypothetical protein
MSLPADIWKPWQPRVYFPFFSGVENTFEFTVQDTLAVQGWRNFAYPAYTAYKKQKTWGHALHDYLHLLGPDQLSFTVHSLNEDGTYRSAEGTFGPFAIGQSFVFKKDLSEKPEATGMMVFVASRGRIDKMTSSPGNMTVRYASKKSVAGYRTGFFARPLNSGKGHYGFMGLNPALSKNSKLQSGILLINHSSDPAYENSANPVVRVYKSSDSYLEADFGAILPHSFKERSLDDLFPNFESWCGHSEKLWTVAHCKGFTLASFHTYRDQAKALMAIEHSRPSHAQVINYWKQK